MFFSTPQPMSQTKQRGFRDLERKQVVLEQVPFIRYGTIHHLEPTTEF
jgi:hypothetical protein